MEVHAPFVIGMAGGSASGKTFILNHLSQRFPPESLAILSMDNYYHPLENQQPDGNGAVNFDIPAAVDFSGLYNDLHLLLSGRSVSRMEYTFNTQGAIPQPITVLSAPVILVEGIFIFYDENIKASLDLKVFLDSRDDIKLLRRLQRDEKERGISREEALYQWEHHVYPGYKKYLLPYKDEADIILTNNGNCEKAVEVLQAFIASKIHHPL
jgi:uridine kinase